MAKSTQAAPKSEVAVKAKNEIANIVVPQVLIDKFEKLGVSNEEASALLTNFGIPLNEVGPILETYKDIEVKSAEDTDQQAKARETRLILKKIRTGVENTRKSLKAEYLRKGDAIQAVANYIREAIEPAEAYLQLQEDFIRVQEEKATADRIAKRTARIIELGAEPAIYSLGDMSEDAFESLVTGLVDANEAKAAREKLEAEEAAKLEAERVEREKKLAEENTRLKAEADEREKLAADEKAKADEIIAAERAKTQKLEQDQRDREAAAAKVLEDERIAAEKAEADKLAAAKAAAMSPDKDKLIGFAKGLLVVVDTRLPDVQSAEAKEIVELIRKGLTTYATTITEKAQAL